MANIASIIDLHLSSEHTRLLRVASDFAATTGVELYLVGGTVRDLLLGQSPLDIDISAAGSPDGFDSGLASHIGGAVTSRSQFGTSKLGVGGLEIDLAITRKESYAFPGALPDVEPGSIWDDLARRDFSINAMAASLNNKSWGEVLDPFNGQSDLENKSIKALHSKSFVDDATRILRALRYAGRLGFRLEKNTEGLIRRDLGYLDTIKGDRIRHEFERIFHENKAVPILKLAQDLGVLSAVYEPLKLEDAIWDRLQEIGAENSLENDLLFVSILAYCIPSNRHSGLISRLNMDSLWEKVVRDTGAINKILDQLRALELRRSQIYDLLKPFDQAALQGCALMAKDPLASRRIELYMSELSRVRGILNGDDIIALGVPESPRIGQLLRDILKARLDGVLRSRDDEEEFVRSHI